MRGSYNPAQRIIQEVEAEILRLQAARALLAGETNARKVGKPGTRKKSAATRAKMAEAQQARWAKRDFPDAAATSSSLRAAAGDGGQGV